MTISELVEIAIKEQIDLANGSVDWIGEYADGSQCGTEGILVLGRGDAADRLGRIVEWSNRSGHTDYTIDSYDEVSLCGDCYRAIQTQPDHWGWRPAFVVWDGDISCLECVGVHHPESLADLVEDSGDVAPVEFDWAEHGWTQCGSFYGDHVTYFNQRREESQRHQKTLKSSYRGVIDSDGYLWIRKEGGF